ncbi:MAG: OsmC family protein [Thermodesulfobacteriota bacterium]
MAPDKVNGIDVGMLGKTVNSIKAKPGLGKFTFRASNEWVEGTNNRATVKGFFGAGEEHPTRKTKLIYEEDEPPVLLGADKGANPVEYVLVGLSGCLTTSLVASAAARGIKLKRVESELEGNLDVRGFLGIDESVRKGFQDIAVRFTIDADASEEQIEDLMDYAKEHSPVFDIVSHRVPVSVSAVKA